MNHRQFLAIFFAILLFAAPACSGDGADAEGSAETAETAQAETQEAPAEAPAPQQPEEFAGSHILIMYLGSMRAPETVTRNKEEALTLATELSGRAQKGEDFAELAKEYSDGPSGPNGGNLGVWPKGRMVPEFDAAIAKLDIGSVSDPVETQFGYHVIKRNKVEKVGCRHILVMHDESMRKPPQIERTKEEALARAEEALAKAQAGESFEDLAREYSDGPSAPRGGDLGSFGKGAMVPEFEEVAFALEIDGISGVVETPFGYHIIQRYK